MKEPVRISDEGLECSQWVARTFDVVRPSPSELPIDSRLLITSRRQWIMSYIQADGPAASGWTAWSRWIARMDDILMIRCRPITVDMIHQWIMSHPPVDHVASTSGSCRIHQWIMSHPPVDHVASASGSCRIHQWIMSHPPVDHVVR
jgi:hypothetical protein